MTKTNSSSVRPPAESKEGATLEIEDPSQTSTINDDRDEYLLIRHGTLELNPLPSSSPKDPFNWPIWKKNVHVLMVAFHAMLTTFTAACIIPGFHSFALKYGTSIEQASYLTSAQVSQFLPQISGRSYPSILLTLSRFWRSDFSLCYGIRYLNTSAVALSSSFRHWEAASVILAVYSVPHMERR
jgi:hypothetical protein